MDPTTELATLNAKYHALSVLRPGLATGKWECPGARQKTVPTRVLNQDSPDAAVGAVIKMESTATHARNSGTSQPLSEWIRNDWLADGMPTKYALLLPDERKAFNRIRRSPEEFNSSQSDELLEGLAGWLRTNVPENTVTPPASDDGVPVVPWHYARLDCYAQMPPSGVLYCRWWWHMTTGGPGMIITETAGQVAPAVGRTIEKTGVVVTNAMTGGC